MCRDIAESNVMAHTDQINLSMRRTKVYRKCRNDEEERSKQFSVSDANRLQPSKPRMISIYSFFQPSVPYHGVLYTGNSIPSTCQAPPNQFLSDHRRFVEPSQQIYNGMMNLLASSNASYYSCIEFNINSVASRRHKVRLFLSR